MVIGNKSFWLYGVSKNNVWQGDPNANLSDPDLSALVNTSIEFQYWGHEDNTLPKKVGKPSISFLLRKMGLTVTLSTLLSNYYSSRRKSRDTPPHNYHIDKTP